MICLCELEECPGVLSWPQYQGLALGRGQTTLRTWHDNTRSSLFIMCDFHRLHPTPTASTCTDLKLEFCQGVRERECVCVLPCWQLGQTPQSVSLKQSLQGPLSSLKSNSGLYIWILSCCPTLRGREHFQLTQDKRAKKGWWASENTCWTAEIRELVVTTHFYR